MTYLSKGLLASSELKKKKTLGDMIYSQNVALAKSTVLRAAFVTVYKTAFGAVLRRKFKLKSSFGFVCNSRQFIIKIFRGLLLLPSYVF